MSLQLPHAKIGREVYERPSQRWVCGWLREGRPCQLGPTPRGRCVVTAECAPRRKGDGWVCSRTQEHGGACEEGPLPDGGCGIPILPCQPVRSIRAQRLALVFWSLGLTLGILLLAYAGPWRESFISAGELGFQHRTIVQGCAGCHIDMDDDNVNGNNLADGTAHSMSENCLGCHDFGGHGLQIHSVAPARIASLTEVAQAKADLTEPPLLLALARLMPGARAYTEGELPCARCHSEHHGKDFDARQLGDMQCQACHAVQFSSFADGHPDFTSYPYERRTRIIFDHARHEGAHYGDTDRAFQCSDCHQPDAAGRQMTLKPFDSSCLDCHGKSKTTSPSKVYHHGNQIAGGGYNIVFFTLPRIDLKVLEKKKIDIGFWPEGTRKASRDGLTRLGITPFTELLISADPAVAAALARLNDKNVQLRSLRKAKTQDLADVAEVIWAIKELLIEIEGVDDGALPLRHRLDRILQRKLSTREVAALNGQIPRLMFRTALTAWFPWPEDAKQPDLYKEVEHYREMRCASDPQRCTQPREASEAEQEGEAIGVQWVKTGDWGRNRYSLQYRVSGHADDFLQAWLDLGFELSKSPMTINKAGKAIYDELADSGADPGESKGPGRCMKCHSLEVGNGQLIGINWKPFQPRTDLHTFTVFRHEPHLQLGDQQACIVCHEMQSSEKSDSAKTVALASYASPSVTDFTGNFTPMTKETCVDCHTAIAAGDTCLSCHNYHVGTFMATMMRSTSAPDAADGAAR